MTALTYKVNGNTYNTLSGAATAASGRNIETVYNKIESDFTVSASRYEKIKKHFKIK